MSIGILVAYSESLIDKGDNMSYGVLLTKNYYSELYLIVFGVPVGGRKTFDELGENISSANPLISSSEMSVREDSSDVSSARSY